MAVAFAVAGCQPKKVAVETPEPQVSDWDSGLSVELEFEAVALRDSVAVTALATATNVTQRERDICVNLHFVAGFQELTDPSREPEPPRLAPTSWSGREDVREIARSRWRKYGNANCVRRALEPNASFQERFDFTYSAAEFAGLAGGIFVMCEIWFQTRVDIPDRSLTCDTERFGFGEVPGP